MESFHNMKMWGTDPFSTPFPFWRDWQRGGRSEKPGFLNEYILDEAIQHSQARERLPKRQARHLQA